MLKGGATIYKDGDYQWVTPYIWNGEAWKRAVPYVWNGSAYKESGGRGFVMDYFVDSAGNYFLDHSGNYVLVPRQGGLVDLLDSANVQLISSNNYTLQADR